MKIDKIVFLALCILTNYEMNALTKKILPKVTVIIVIDGCAYHYFTKLNPFFRDGFKTFFDKGTVYTQARQLNGATVTAVGHSVIATGTSACNHGVVGNSWINEKMEEIKAFSDSSPDATMLNTPLNEKGVSCNHLMVDTISDQFELAYAQHRKNRVFAFSLKDRAAVPMAGKKGKAIWFHEKTGIFTSSKAYFSTLPEWVTQFNKNSPDLNKSTLEWERKYSKDSQEYNFERINTYSHASRAAMIDKKFNRTDDTKEFFNETLGMLPVANKVLLDLVVECLKNNKEETPLLLWVSLSSLDKIGHVFGPESAEVIDMMYHLDSYIGEFIQSVNSIIGASNTLYVLTADHGMTPIPEYKAKDFPLAQRILEKDLITLINAQISKKYKMENVIRDILGGSVYLNHEIVNRLKNTQKRKLMNNIKMNLAKCSGIKRVYTQKDILLRASTGDHFAQITLNQLYPGRSADLFIQVHPYVVIDSHAQGTDHTVPYEYNAHVPLIFYRPNQKPVFFNDLVDTTQIAPTLAQLLEISRPSASISKVLPWK